MSKVFNLSTNLTNGAGLQRDYELLRRMLESYGHKVNGLMFNDYQQAIPQADITICLEVINDRQLGRDNWIVPNSEWWYPCWERTLPRFSKVLCKTKDAYEIWVKKVGAARCVYIGFESLDFCDSAIPRTPKFLHMAGKSETKNTAAVCEAWRKHNLPYPLTVVAFKPEIVRLTVGVPNCRWIERLTDTEVATAMNEHLFHVMPSKYEGFGHYIHEAIGCYGLVLTTNAPPMNQFNGISDDLLIPVVKREPRLAAFFNIVSADGVAETVHRAARMPQERRNVLMDAARAAFVSDRDAFRQAFKQVANA